MYKHAATLTFAIVLARLLHPTPSHADSPREHPNFHTVTIEDTRFWSDGTRLAGNILRPADNDPTEPLPGLVMCHGWGGLKAHLNPQIAPRFAEAGYVVLTFDYRGWGESNSRLIVEGDMPKPDEDEYVTVKARAVRQLVDPLDQQEDIDAAITFLEGEPGVDADRIGLWGSSFGGGHAVWRAAHDDRVKCVLAQVASMNARSVVASTVGLDAIHRRRIQRVRGELPPVPESKNAIPGLMGAPYFERFAQFAPNDHADDITVPIQIIDAENEHYFDIAEHGEAVYQAVKDNVPAEYHVLAGAAHYDVYRGDALDKCLALQIPWLDKHLKQSRE